MTSDCNIGRLNNDLNQCQNAYVSKISLTPLWKRDGLGKGMKTRLSQTENCFPCIPWVRNYA